MGWNSEGNVWELELILNVELDLGVNLWFTDPWVSKKHKSLVNSGAQRSLWRPNINYLKIRITVYSKWLSEATQFNWKIKELINHVVMMYMQNFCLPYQLFHIYIVIVCCLNVLKYSNQIKSPIVCTLQPREPDPKSKINNFN